MGNPVNKLMDNVLGINPPDMPSAPAPQAAPEVRKDTQDLPDQNAIAAAKQKLEEEKLRRGRKSLRQDLNVSTSGVGAGVAIPK